MPTDTTSTTSTTPARPTNDKDHAEVEVEGEGEGTFTLLLFAAASTHANNTESLSLCAPTTLPALFDALEARFPGIKRRVLSSAAVTLNLEYVELEVDREGNVLRAPREDGKGEVVIRAGDEVGIVPPVSSG